MVADVASDVVLGLAVVIVLASSLGVLVMDDVYQKVHFVTPAAVVAPFLVAVAILIKNGWHEDATQTLLAVLFMAILGPFLSHATIRAARIRAEGDWRSSRRPGAESR